ncbi:hypothetical protein B0T14DRAFT_229519 [Immersiella caudata]|uniref:Uncharacterized protein n=1 Tax=Immersiella caudata TaxID=314043 RepID=A0AA39WRM8_9PEZI|nr:hypothetical protein B0T14DRAFT_229519 [Immersiella caudata]
MRAIACCCSKWPACVLCLALLKRAAYRGHDMRQHAEGGRQLGTCSANTIETIEPPIFGIWVSLGIVGSRLLSTKTAPIFGSSRTPASAARVQGPPSEDHPPCIAVAAASVPRVPPPASVVGPNSFSRTQVPLIRSDARTLCSPRSPGRHVRYQRVRLSVHQMVSEWIGVRILTVAVVTCRDSQGRVSAGGRLLVCLGGARFCQLGRGNQSGGARKALLSAVGVGRGTRGVIRAIEVL